MDLFTKPVSKSSVPAARVSITPRKSLANNNGILSPKTTNKFNNTPRAVVKNVNYSCDTNPTIKPTLLSSALKSPASSVKYSYTIGNNNAESHSIRVLVRPRQATTDATTICVSGSDSIIYKSSTQLSGRSTEFTYDRVLTSESTQLDVYESCQADMMCKDVCNGYNAGIMLYGQTNAGKTYTSGISCRADTPSEQCGLAPRIIHKLLQCIESLNTNTNNDNMKYSLTCQYIEIYLERVYDLLGNKKPQLKLGLDSDKNFCAVGATVRNIESVHDGMKALSDGFSQRTTAATNKNKQSSRSHALVIFTVIQSCESTNEFDELVIEKRQSKLYLADLAGSETSSATDGLSRELREQGSSINLSLMTLRLVLKSLTDKQSTQLPPYNDSELTRLLKPCTGGSAKTVFIGCIHSDTDGESSAQTLSTLQYCSMAKKITNQVKQSKSIVSKEHLQQENIELKQYLTHIKDEVIGVLGAQFTSPLASPPPKSLLSPQSAIKPNSLFGDENVNINNDNVNTPNKQHGAHYKFVFSPNTTQLTKQLDTVINKVRLSLRGSLATSGDSGTSPDSRSTTYLRNQLSAQNEFVESLKHELECEKVRYDDVMLQIQQYKHSHQQIQCDYNELDAMKQQCEIAVEIVQHELNNAIESQFDLKQQIGLLHQQLHQTQIESDVVSSESAAQLQAMEFELQQRKDMFVEQLVVSELNYTELQCTLVNEKQLNEQLQSDIIAIQLQLQQQLDDKQHEHIEAVFDLESQIHRLNAELQSVRQINIDQSNTINELNDVNQTNQQQYNQQVVELQQTIQQYQQQTQDITNKYDNAVQQHNAQLYSQQQQLSAAALTMQSTQLQLSSSEQQLQSVQTDLSDKIAENRKLRTALSKSIDSGKQAAVEHNAQFNELTNQCLSYQRHIDRLSDDKLTLQSTSDHTMQQLNQSNAVVEQLRGVEQQLKADVELHLTTIHQCTGDMESAATQHNAAVDGLNQQITNLSHQLDELKADNIRLRVQLSHSSDQIDSAANVFDHHTNELNQQIQQLTGNNQLLQSMLDDRIRTVNELQQAEVDTALSHKQTVDALHSQLNNLNNDQQEAQLQFNNQLNALNQQIAIHHSEINRLSAVEQQLLTELGAAGDRIESMRIHLLASNDTIDMQCIRIKALSSNVITLQSEAAQENQRFVNLQNTFDHATLQYVTELTQQNNQMDELSQSLQRSKDTVRDHENELLRLVMELSELKSLLCHASNESVQLTQLQQLNNKLLEQIKAYKVGTASQTESIDTLSQQLHSMNQQVSTITIEYNVVKQRCVDQEQELILTNDELNSIKQQLSTEQQNSNELRSHVIELCLSSDQLRAQLDQADYNWLIDVDNSKKVIQSMKHETQELVHTNQQMLLQIQQLNNAKHELDQQLQSAETMKHKTKHLASKLADELITSKKSLHSAEFHYQQQVEQYNKQIIELNSTIYDLQQQLLHDAMDLESNDVSVQLLNEQIVSYQQQLSTSQSRLSTAGDGLQSMHNRMNNLLKRKDEYKLLYKDAVAEKNGLQSVFDALSEQVQQLIIQQQTRSNVQPSVPIVNNYMYADTDSVSVPIIDPLQLSNLLSPNVRGRDGSMTRRNSAVMHEISVLDKHQQNNPGWCTIQ